MTVPTYNALSDASLQPGQPITTSMMFALRDNPLAIAGADISAPRVFGANVELVDEFVVTSDTALVILGEMTTKYDAYIVECSGLSGTSSSAGLNMRISTDGGTSVVTSTSYYNAQAIGNNFTVGGAPNGSSISTGASVVPFSSSTPQCQLNAFIQNPTSATRKGFFFDYVSGSTSGIAGSGAKVVGWPGAFNGIGFFLSSGSFNKGEFRLYGLRKE